MSKSINKHTFIVYMKKKDVPRIDINDSEID